MNSRRSESLSTPQVSNTHYLLKLRNINTHRLWLLETSYDVTYEATSRSRARSLSLYSLDGAALSLSPFSRHRSLKKHLADSLVSSPASRVDAGPRVCPFCPAVAVPRQDLIFLSFRERPQKSINKKKCHRHIK